MKPRRMKVREYSGLNVYLAGKIYANDWRHDMLRRYSIDQFYEGRVGEEWVVSMDAMGEGINYTGPYPIGGCSHCSYHGENTHGNGLGSDRTCLTPPTKEFIFTQCENAIRESDVLFAWIDTNDCYGTLVEIGMAKAMGIWVFVAGNEYLNDMWFAYTAADKVVIDPYRSVRDIAVPWLTNFAEQVNAARDHWVLNRQ